MPRVKQVVARKDYPEHGIKKGEKHYHWKRKTGPYSSKEYRQLTPPRIEQLTSSSYRIATHYIAEAINAVALPDDIDGVIEQLETLRDEQQEKFDNMPDGLQQGDTGQLLEQQAQAADDAVSELETIRDEWQAAIEEHDEQHPDPDADDYEDYDHSDFIDRVNDVTYEA